MKIKSWVEGLKFAKVANFLIELANSSNVDIKVTYVDKGWIREKVYYELDGSEENINSFKRKLTNTVYNYNK